MEYSAYPNTNFLTLKALQVENTRGNLAYPSTLCLGIPQRYIERAEILPTQLPVSFQP